METYYAECEVKFIDNSDEEPWISSESYTFIITANNKKEARKEAEKLGREELIHQLGIKDNVSVVIHQLYRTTDDARSS